jgi:mitogen-activated protein kinase kinase kinase 9
MSGLRWQMCNLSDNVVVAACWYSDPHLRPAFEDILQALDAIVHSAFTQTPHESFHTMQEDWKLEIEEVLLGLRMKEKVYLNLTMQEFDIN